MRTLPCRRALRSALWAMLAALAACNTGGDEMGWARAALERNDRLEIVAEDADARTFTVRVRDSGELRVVRTDEIAATVTEAKAGSLRTSAAPAAPQPDTPRAGGPESSAAAPGESASAAPPQEPAEPAERADTPREPAAAAGTGKVIASGPGYSIQAGEQTAPATRAVETTPVGAAGERRTEPLVCQGARFLRIDGRTIAFEGDALVAEEGCELYITNSRITARGVGVAARGASVHIKNSTVAGGSGAIHASGNAQIYAQSSRFSGMVRRLDDAVLHDLGDNVWN
jgi:uncharacterized Zn-binding protein involved in type VI secretion